MWNDDAEWSGDYIGAGVGAITLWVDNRSGAVSNLSLRIAFFSILGGWFTSNAQTVSDTNAGNEWTQLTFTLAPANFTFVTGGGGTAVFNDTFASVSRFEIFVSAGAPVFAGGGNLLRGDQIISDLRFDDIKALPVPEPNNVVALGIVIVGLFFWQQIRRRTSTLS